MQIKTQENTSRSGSALVIVLWVTGLLAMFVMAFAFDMHIEARITSTWRRKLKAEYLARSGVELTRAALLAKDDPELQNTEPELYLSLGGDEEMRGAALALSRGGGAELTRELGGGTITVSIRPENSRINLQSLINVDDRELTYETMTPLFENAGIPWEMRDELVDCLLDWVDQDELVRLGGVESQYYQSLDPPYSSKNRMVDTVDELILIKGFNEIIPGTEITMYEALAGFLTTYAEDQKININAVDALTLMAFLNIDEQMADQIIAERAGPDGIDGTADDTPFQDLQDLLARVPILNETAGDHIAFDAMGRYAIRSSGRVQDVEHVVNCVIRQDEDELVILNWSEGDALVQ